MYQKNDGITRKVLRPPTARVGTVLVTLLPVPAVHQVLCASYGSVAELSTIQRTHSLRRRSLHRRRRSVLRNPPGKQLK